MHPQTIDWISSRFCFVGWIIHVINKDTSLLNHALNDASCHKFSESPVMMDHQAGWVGLNHLATRASGPGFPGPPARDMQTMRSERSRYKHSCPWCISPPARPGLFFLGGSGPELGMFFGWNSESQQLQQLGKNMVQGNKRHKTIDLHTYQKLLNNL